MEYNIFKKLLVEKIKVLNIELQERQIRQFYDYMIILLEENQKYYLTCYIEPKEIILRHFLNSLIISRYIPAKAKVIDVGTGAGFPGIPLKIVNNNIEISLLDKNSECIHFLNLVIEKLELKQIKAIHGRAENLEHNNEYKEKYDIAISRGLIKMPMLFEYTIPFAKKGGECIYIQRHNIEEKELENAKKVIKELEGELKERIILPNFKSSITIIQKSQF